MSAIPAAASSPAFACRSLAAAIWLACAPFLAPLPSARAAIQLSLDLAGLREYLASDVLTTLPQPAVIGVEQIVAFEDHEQFTYVLGASRAALRGQSPENERPRHLRRVYFIRPQLMVIDDQVDAGGSNEMEWAVRAPGRQELAGPDVTGDVDGFRFRCRSLLPEKVAWTTRIDDAGRRSAGHFASAGKEQSGVWIRLLHAVSFAENGEAALPQCSVERQAGAVRLEWIEPSGTPGQTTRLWIPDGLRPGRIEMVAGQETLLRKRVLPAGILPPDLAAARRRLQWDLPYQIEGQAIWDIRHASSELKRFVESGRIMPCRAVEIGCGTGNDAIYLAAKGFDVSAIDISPTALGIAEQKAERAGVKVDWLLADILHPPQLLEPFDFIYDRGCYHEVRQRHAQQYVAALHSLSRKNSKILILAASANKDHYWRFAGPPRVREQDLRTDFAAFRLLRLREFRFDPAPPEQEGPLAWSILLAAPRE